MALVIKSYDPAQHQQRAQRRRQKQLAERSTLAPRSATCLDSLFSPTLATSLKCSQADHRFIPPNNPGSTQDPYYEYPSSEEVLEFCSRGDTTVPSAYTPSSENLQSRLDSTIEIQDASLSFDHQNDRFKDKELQQKLRAAIDKTPWASELNNERETYNDNASCISISEKASDEEDSPIVSVWSPDLNTTQSAGSSINTPSVKSPACHIENQRDQDAFVDSVHDACTWVVDLDVPGVMSSAAPSVLNLPVLEPHNRIVAEPSSSVSSNEPHNSHGQDLRALALAASTALETVKEPAVAKPAVTSSTKRSLSESDVIDDSHPLVSDICQASKRPKLTSPSYKEVISTLLLDMQELISKTLAKLDVDQPQSSGVCTSSTSDTIIVATDGGGASISIDDASTPSGLPKGRLRRTRRRKWEPGEDKLLQDLKRLQEIHQSPSDRVIAARLNRTESAVKQHWDIMEKERRRLRETR
ncbi:hypothetical protein FPRO05_14260 [Fusarium proliferatum]|uniref:Myb-like domain-containing protein n=1 Tax=Gibberella intermedia TaxID=948311 RepID=A0A365MTN4_GIBIN|nr:hypothetical protein FPRO05_14260 [Fusarium proliferatum]